MSGWTTIISEAGAAARDALVAEAKRWDWVREVPPGSNRGVAIDFALELTMGPGHVALPWCAAWVALMGRLALGRQWPVPQTASVNELVIWGTKNGAFRIPGQPRPGDVFCLFYPSLERWGHTGIVTAVDGETIHTIEGNTTLDGSREGWGVFERPRKISARFGTLAWAEQL